MSDSIAVFKARIGMRRIQRIRHIRMPRMRKAIKTIKRINIIGTLKRINTTYITHTNVTANVFHRMSRQKKIKRQMVINAATVAMLLRTYCGRCPARKHEEANDNQRGNGRIVTASVLHTVPPPKENAQANAN